MWRMTWQALSSARPDHNFCHPSAAVFDAHEPARRLAKNTPRSVAPPRGRAVEMVAVDVVGRHLGGPHQAAPAPGAYTRSLFSST